MKKLISSNNWAWNSIASTVILFQVSQAIMAQQVLPVVHATSKVVNIKDGQTFQKGVWNLSPEIQPDTYYALDPLVENKITFYTNVDSISFHVAPGNNYDFIILLNQKDTCYTRITTINHKAEIINENTISGLINPEELKEDFKQLKKSLEQEHAGLYRYKSPIEIEKVFDSCFVLLEAPMTQFEFGKIVMFLISQIEDGHTGTNLPSLIMKRFGEHEKMFPINLYFIDDKAFVLCSMNNKFPVGTEIISIDDKPVKDIQNEMFRYLPSDGKIKTKKRHIINNGAFPFLYTLIWGDSSGFSVGYKNEKGENKMVYVIAEFLKDFSCEIVTRSSNTKALSLQILDKESALLTIKTFDENRVQENFSHFLDHSFEEINTYNLKNLIIDLRGNGGGTDNYGALLYSYLSTKPFQYFSSIETTKEKVKIEDNPLLSIQQPQKNSFKGDVYILIDGLCFSTTADFCAVAKSNKRAIFIGEETGGGYYGNTSGGKATVKLNNSKIDLNIPKVKYVNAVKKLKHSDRGIIPDYKIVPDILEVINNEDPQLGFVLNLLKK